MSNELPTDKEIDLQARDIFCPYDGGDTQYNNEYGNSCYQEGAKWMREKALKALAEEKERHEKDTGAKVWNTEKIPDELLVELHTLDEHKERIKASGHISSYLSIKKVLEHLNYCQNK